jgi:ABC-type transport system involved in cytochrome c biogenesis permease subunit
VLLASSGLSLLGLAALAGLLFLAEHRRLKAKRPAHARFPLPSLEALDRANVAALTVGFPLLTLGVITGALWSQTARGQLWGATPHEISSLVAWVVYAVLVTVRFGSDQGSRQAAVSAVGGFALLFLAVIGVELFL